MDDVNLPLILTVTEKHEKDVLGQVVVPLSELRNSFSNHASVYQLQPHKKCPKPDGELQMEAWISSTLPSIIPNICVTDLDGNKKHSSMSSGFRKLKDMIAISPKLTR